MSTIKHGLMWFLNKWLTCLMLFIRVCSLCLLLKYNTNRSIEVQKSWLRCIWSYKFWFGGYHYMHHALQLPFVLFTIKIHVIIFTNMYAHMHPYFWLKLLIKICLIFFTHCVTSMHSIQFYVFISYTYFVHLIIACVFFHPWLSS